jgi:hypothetical protein
MTPTKLRSLLLPGIAAAVLLAPGLRAANNGAGAGSLLSGSTVTLLDSLRPQLAGRLATSGRQISARTPRPTQFHSSGSRLVVNPLLQSLAGGPDGAKILLPLIEPALADYEKQAAASGFANDVAGAMALFVGAADLCYRGHEMTDPQSDVVVRQLQAVLDTPEMRAANDRTKQELYEFLTTNGLYLLVIRQLAIERHNAGALNNLKLGAGETVRWLFQVSPERVTVSDQGLSLAAESEAVVATVAPPAAPAPTAIVDSTGIVGIWNGFGIESSLHSTTNASGTGFSSFGFSPSLRVREVAFLASGWFTTAVPPGGFRGVDPAAAAAKEPYFWGRYTFDGRRGMMNFAAGGPSPFEIVDGKLHYDDFEFDTRKPIQ